MKSYRLIMMGPKVQRLRNQSGWFLYAWTGNVEIDKAKRSRHKNAQVQVMKYARVMEIMVDGLRVRIGSKDNGKIR